MKLKKLPPGGTLYGLALMLVAVFYFCYAYLPLLDKTAVLNAEHMENREQIAIFEGYNRDVPKMKEEIAALNAQKAKAAENAPLQGVQIINDINAGLIKYGITPQSISMNDESAVTPEILSYDKKPLYFVSIGLGFSAPPDKLNQLLRYFETESDGAYYVTSLSVTGQDDEHHIVSLSLNAYYYAAQSDVIAEAPLPTDIDDGIKSDEDVQRVIDESTKTIKEGLPSSEASSKVAS